MNAIEFIEGESEDARETKLRQIAAVVALQAYHGRVINIPERYPKHMTDSDARHRYRVGHRDARHDAAEIANEADVRIAELVEEVKRQRNYIEALEHDVGHFKARLAEAEAKERSHALIAEQLENAIDCMATAEAEAKRLRSALEMVEWVSIAGCDHAMTECPWCGGFDWSGGHEDDCARQAALRPEQPHTHYCQEHGDRWECKDGNCERGEVSGCPGQPADATPTPAMLDAREACREAEGK